MSYIEGRVVHDADSHVMETPDWLSAFAADGLYKRLESLMLAQVGELGVEELTRCRSLHADSDYRSQDAVEILQRKNWRATGSFLRQDRAEAVDLLGVASQLVFPTLCNVMLETLEGQDDMELLYGAASSTNRAQVEFCSVDPRLLPAGYLPLADLERAPVAAAEALELGCQGLVIPSACPRHHATSHIALDRVWAQLEEAGIPLLFHVGAADQVLPPAHANNGLPPVLDFHGGGENFRSISYMAIPSRPMQALSLLILDGVLDRFPKMMVGVIELGAVWVPGFLRQLDAAVASFGRGEERLRNLSAAPSEIFRRQVRVTPYPTEPTGWIIEESGPEICMFSTDYPHVEGGRNPVRRFESTLEDFPMDSLDRFFRKNFESLMGSNVPA